MYRVLRHFGVFSGQSSPLAAPSLQGMEVYYQALEQLEAKNFENARANLQVVLNKLTIDRRDDYASYAVAATLLAKTFYYDSMFSEVESVLKKLVERLEKQPDQILYTRACLNLLIQYMHSNAPEAVRFSRKMLDISHWAKLDPSFHTDWHFLRGTALTLMGADLPTAKRHFDMAHMNQSLELRPYLLNNLACAQWWHLLQFRKVHEKHNTELKQAVEDFNYCVPNLQRAIGLFEGKENTLHTLESGVPKSKISNTSLCNLSEVHYECRNEEAIQWWQFALAHSKLHCRTELCRILAHLAEMLINEDVERAEVLIQDAYKGLPSEDDCRTAFILEVHMRIVSRIKSRKDELREMGEKLSRLNANIPPWAWPGLHLYIPEWHLI